MQATWSEYLRREPAATAALAIFAVSLAPLCGAWFFQFGLKLPPCPLCLDKRVPYSLVIPLSLWVAIAALSRAPRSVVAGGFAVLLVAMLVSAVLGAYHAGVEW